MSNNSTDFLVLITRGRLPALAIQPGLGLLQAGGLGLVVVVLLVLLLAGTVIGADFLCEGGRCN